MGLPFAAVVLLGTLFSELLVAEKAPPKGYFRTFFAAGGRAGPTYNEGYFPRVLEYLPATRLKAEALRRSNEARLDAILSRLRSGDEAALCGAAPLPWSKKLVRWLHVPKCGSTFFNTVLKYGCPALRARPDLYLGAPVPRDMREFVKKHSGPRTTDVIKEPVLAAFVEDHCRKGSRLEFHETAMGGVVGKMAREAGGRPLEYLVKMWASHTPLRQTRPRSFLRDDHVVGMFRSPSQRLISAYNFNLHVWGSEMVGANGTIGSKHFGMWRAWVKGGETRPRNALQFGLLPGVGGCLAKMLSGCYCATRPEAVPLDNSTAMFPNKVACPSRWSTVGEVYAHRAAARIDNLGFVGLQDAYNASVCLFHRIYGGKADQSEFSFFNVGDHNTAKKKDRREHTSYTLEKDAPKTTRWDKADLGDHVDYVDEIVWASILTRFERDLDAALTKI